VLLSWDSATFEKREVIHEIVTRTVIAKSARKCPIILTVPCRNPVVTFRYPPSLIKNVHAFSLFTASEPYGSIVNRSSGPANSYQEVSVSLRAPGRVVPWTFPTSGLVFTWDS
jgi:hypothetical protein